MPLEIPTKYHSLKEKGFFKNEFYLHVNHCAYHLELGLLRGLILEI